MSGHTSQTRTQLHAPALPLCSCARCRSVCPCGCQPPWSLCPRVALLFTASLSFSLMPSNWQTFCSSDILWSWGYSSGGGTPAWHTQGPRFNPWFFPATLQKMLQPQIGRILVCPSPSPGPCLSSLSRGESMETVMRSARCCVHSSW